MLDRTPPLYRAVYRQRTSAEHINSQAKARCIERPKVRNGRSVNNLNTLTYLVIKRPWQNCESLVLRVGTSCWRRFSLRNVLAP